MFKTAIATLAATAAVGADLPTGVAEPRSLCADPASAPQNGESAAHGGSDGTTEPRGPARFTGCPACSAPGGGVAGADAAGGGAAGDGSLVILPRACIRPNDGNREESSIKFL